jgi:ABC-type uncharacterized transport system involved in gliding motility auxiliary subunit
MKSEKRHRHILTVGILIMVALLAARFHARLDLTQRGDYTLSAYTRSVISGIDSPVQVTWYRSDILPSVSPDIRHVADLLEEYRIVSSGKFTWKIIDPASSSNSAKPESLGIMPKQIETGAQGNTTIRTLYSGLLIEYGSSASVIPFVSESRLLEYDLTRMIVDLRFQKSGAARREIQVLNGSGNTGDLYKYVAPWLSYAGFSVKVIPPRGALLDADVPLIVIGSSALDEISVDAVDSFLSAGGAAAFFLSGTEIKTNGDWTATLKYNDRLIALLATRGVRVGSDLLIDKRCYRMTLPSLDNSKYETVDYPFWVTANPVQDSAVKGLGAGIDALQFYWPSSVTITPDALSSYIPFARASGESAIKRQPFDTNPFGNQIDGIAANGKEDPAAIAVFGSEEKRARFIVVADELLPSSMNDYTGSDRNLDFLVNCAEWLSGRDAILSLKKTPKSTDSSRLIDRDSAAYRATAIASLVAIPLALLVMLGVSIATMRKRR